MNAKKSAQMQGPFSTELLEKIKDRLSKKEGVILFQNRRGYSTMLECPDCADIPKCENCSVSLTLHKRKNQLRCHYCGYVISAFRDCRVCGYPELKESGVGTQKIEEQLDNILKSEGIEAQIVRMDLDTTRRKGVHARLLKDFADGTTDILVGTQMVAKGLDFERVTLVGVMNADTQLFLPDFRAMERTFQLLVANI